MKSEKIELVYYTDPLCCWSWALEPRWRKFVFLYREHISWRYCLSGLIPDWNNFFDEANSITRPAQLGPIWMEAQMASGMPIASAVWHVSPPSSSFPACIAVKCACLQSSEIGELYLRRVREAIMIERRDISKSDVLMNIARRLANEVPGLDLEQFTSHYKGPVGADAFRKDWLEARGLGITRYPTITMSVGGGRVMVSGYSAFATLRNALLHVAPQLSLVENRSPLEDYRRYWPFLTEREEAEFLDHSTVDEVKLSC